MIYEDDRPPGDTGRILIVDDTPENLSVLAQLLRHYGYQVVLARSGKRAIQVATREPPDLVLMDVHMPEMDGYQTCRLLKEDAELKVIPVIFISAATDTEIKVKAFTSGGVDFIAKPFEPEEVIARVRTHLALRSGKQELERRLAEKEREIVHMAYHDTLTDLPNRLLLLNRLEYAIDLATRARTQMAVLFLDLDRFKLINESLGHDIGDHLLMAVSQRLRNIIRRSDIVARLGGDEFVLVMTDFDGPGYVAHVAEKLLSHLLEALTLDGHSVRVTASIGISIFPQDGSDARTLLRSADIAMYRAKEEGRNAFRFFDPTMNSRALERLDLESNLRLAVENQEFTLSFQPKVMLADRKALGTEALIRWNHPRNGLVPPLDFIPLAEETGLIVPIGAWVMRAACEQTQYWRRHGEPDLTVAVNLSARQFNQPDLVKQVLRVLEETGLPAPALEIELTESTVMDNPERAITTLRQLRDGGMRVAVDDFGTGYSSLSYLKKLPINALKIDRSFITDLISDADDAAIVQTIIALGKVLRLEVVAEGVETEQQAQFLADNGCHIGQGYYFARPLEAEALRAWLQQSRDDSNAL